MTIEFTITSPSKIRKYTRTYNDLVPEYAIADDAFMDAIKFINELQLCTLDNIDYDYHQVSSERK